MSLLARDDVWRTQRIGAREVEVLDLQHPKLTERILPDIEAGTKVYYDRRWRVSERFARHLDAHPDSFRDRAVLVLGCGVGLEAIAAAPHASRLVLNDASRTAVELSGVQLERNGHRSFEPLVGRYEDVAPASVDLCIGSFLVYDEETLTSMVALMRRLPVPVLLANDPMDAFDDLRHDCGRRIRRLTPHDDTPIVWFEAADDASAGSALP